jgi:hypothetical protein
LFFNKLSPSSEALKKCKKSPHLVTLFKISLDIFAVSEFRQLPVQLLLLLPLLLRQQRT